MDSPTEMLSSQLKIASGSKTDDLSSLSSEEALRRTRSSRNGISWDEAERRLDTFGLNVPLHVKPKPWFWVLGKSFNNPFNYVLLFLGTVSYLTDDTPATIIMTVMIAVATGLRFWQEMKAIVQADTLRKLVHNTATVYRCEKPPRNARRDSLDHSAYEISYENIAPGDIIRLSAGDMVPADCVLLESRDLFVSQSPLTGEAMPVEKETKQNNFSFTGAVLDASQVCLQGTSIVSGIAKAVVVTTGTRTYMGKLAGKVVGERPETAFDKGVNQVSWVLIKFMMVMVPVVFLINGLTKGNWLEAFLFGIAVAVGLTPEMLPMIVNVNLARGAMAMSRRKCVVKNMSSLQNLGAMDVLCTDKTGTLTQDRVMLIEFLDVEANENLRVLEMAYLNSLFQSGLKNLIDRSVVDRAAQEGIRDLAKAFDKIDEIPFDFERRRMSVLLRHRKAPSNLLICKGAVEEVLAICSSYETDGESRPMTELMREKVVRLRNQKNEDGLRVIAVAYRPLEVNQIKSRVQGESDMVLCGLIAFLDPPKESAREAISLLHDYAVAIKVITGDSALVARRVCQDVDLVVENVLTGDEVDKIDDDALQSQVEATTIFAKITPVQKARIVASLKKNGHTVGFLGDGVNDAMALRQADVGISVDSGTDIAKEAADIILLEKSLLLLTEGIIQGRITFGNIIKYIKMTASSNFGNVLSVLVASAFLPFLPMLAIQLLIQNLLYDISQVSIPWDNVDQDWVAKPRKWSARSIARFMIFIGPISSIFDVTTLLGMWYLFGANSDAKESLFQSGWFVEGLLTQTLIVHMIRTEKIPFLHSTSATPVLFSTGFIMLLGCFIPSSLLGHNVGFVELPRLYWPFLIVTLLGYCLLTQWFKGYYISKFGEWM